MKTSNSPLGFILRLTSVLAIAFVAHAFLQHFLGIGFYQKSLLINYVFNYSITLGFFFVINHFANKQSSQLGFVFLFSSIAKFVLFFLVLAPFIQFEGGVANASFAAFFVPYAISLFLEIFEVIRRLNRD